VLSGHRQIGESSTQVTMFRLRLSLKSGYTAVAPMEVVERNRSILVAETTPMVVIGIILGAFSTGLLCWLT
jgi:hypothetical protein